TGVEIVYLYFQIPLMILVIAPAVDGLRREWREAASILGASAWRVWGRLGVPQLPPPPLAGGVGGLRSHSRAPPCAHRLPRAARGGPIITVVIGSYYTGDVVSNPHFAQALALGMFLVLVAMMALFIPLQRRSARWTR